MPVGEPKKKRRKDRKLSVERRRQRKKMAQNQVGYRKLLAIAHRGTSRCVKVARQTKETGRKMSGRPREASIGETISGPSTKKESGDSEKEERE
jgi:hypothetical protein